MLSDGTLGLFNLTRMSRTKAGWQEIGMLPLKMRKTLGSLFKNIQSFDRIGDAKDVDLIAVWNAEANLKKKRVSIENSIAFYDSQHGMVDEIAGKAAKSLRRFKVRNLTEEAVEESLTVLRDGILASAKLAEAARNLPLLGTSEGAGRLPLHSRKKVIFSRLDVDRPNYKVKENRNRFALVMGIENYANIASAEFAERDAESVKSHLRGLGFPQRNIIYLTGQRAVRSSFEKYLETWLPLNLNKESELFVYFSGHGSPDPKSGSAYLLPWDGDPQFLKNTAYPLKRLYAKLNKLPAKKITVVVDACFSGAGGRSVLARGTRPLVTRVNTNIKLGKLTVFSAADANEITGTYDEKGHGLFTYFFLKGLNGAASTQSGAITAESLHEYLKSKVQDEARRQNRDQTPQLNGRAKSLIR